MRDKSEFTRLLISMDRYLVDACCMHARNLLPEICSPHIPIKKIKDRNGGSTKSITSTNRVLYGTGK